MNGSSPAACGKGAGDAVAASSRDDENAPRAAVLLSSFFRRAAPAAAVLWAACGSIGDPLPPMAHIPEAVGDLAARQVVDEIVVTWSWPLLTTEGAAAGRLSRFTLRAVEVPADAAGLPEAAIDEHGRDVAVVAAGRLAGKAPGDRFELRLPLEDWRLDRTVILAMTADNRAGRAAGYSNQVKLQPIEPPAAAAVAQPVVTQDGIALTWRSPGGAGAYVIERRVGSEPDFSPVARAEQPRFVDRAVQWGRRHEYRIRSFAATVAGEAEGRLSATAAVTPADVFPPAAPQGLRAVSTEAAVELSWSLNREPDLAGYRVLRDGKAVSAVVERPAFSDRQASAGREHEYAVVAVDGAGNQSGPSAPVTAAAGR